MRIATYNVFDVVKITAEKRGYNIDDFIVIDWASTIPGWQKTPQLDEYLTDKFDDYERANGLKAWRYR